jgi:ABC-2 type transport system permease protein
MKIIFKIAKNELRNLFYSPVAWFLAIAFFIQCAFFYTSGMQPVAAMQDQLTANNPSWKEFALPITRLFFLSDDGVFANVMKNLFLFIPLLTMGLIGREVNNGTIKLLYSSPVKLRAIVLGKYLAMVIYNLLLVSIVGIFIVLGVFNIKSIDIGLLLSAELGFFLLVCAFSAIGLFMSSLTTYQIVSAVGTFLAIFVLGRIGGLWQKYDFIRDLTWFLSIAGRAEKMIMGLITTKDVFYFLIVIALFLGFTLLKLKGEKDHKPWTVKAVRYIIVTVLSVLLGYITSRPALVGYWDTTAGKINTIDIRTQKLLEQTGNEPLEVTLYTNLLGPAAGPGFPEGRNAYLSNLWDQYLRFKPDITFKYVYYYDNDGSLDDNDLYKTFPHKTEKQIVGIMAKAEDLDSSLFMGPGEIRKIINPYPEDLRLFMAVKYKGRTIHLRTFNDSFFWPDQMQVASGLQRLIQGNVPKIYYLTADLERSIYKTGEREYSGQSLQKSNRRSMINLAFDVDTLSLEGRDIPAETTMLVIADPKTELSAKTLGKVQEYINKGGNLLIQGEPGKQAILNPVLRSLGIQFIGGTLVELNKNETPDKIDLYGTDEANNLAEEYALLLCKGARKERRFDDAKIGIMMPGATAIAYADNGPFKVVPLLKTNEQKTWIKAGKLVTDSVPPVFSPREGDIKDASFVTAVQLTRQVNNKQQRIIVCGDADFRSNQRLYMDHFGNAFPSWLDNNKYPVYIREYRNIDTLLLITGPTASIIKTLFVWVIPGALVLLAAIILIRRKRK